MRVTKKYLSKWLTDKFKELEIPFECVDVVRSYHRSCDIEGGACQLYFRIRPLKENVTMYEQITMLGFYSMGQYQKYLETGYELYLQFDRHYILANCSIEVRKKK